jgi:hypothetical protein
MIFIIKKITKYKIYFIEGIGFGMMNLPSLVMLVEYFDSRLAFATGFANMGTGIGALIFNPLSKVSRYKKQKEIK